MKSIVVQSISGGMDSTALALHHLARGACVHLVSFDYGQKHRLELSRCVEFLAYIHNQGITSFTHRIVSVPFGQFALSALTTPGADVPTGFYEQENMKQTVVPNRNAIFASICYSLALSLANEHDSLATLSLGVHSGDHAIYPDCREPFFDALHKAFTLGNWNGSAVGMSLPFLDLDKTAILRDALHSCEVLGLDFDEVFRRTSTSYAPTEDGLADGRTGSDVERVLAFHEIGRVDPVPYKDGWDATLAYALDVRAKHLAANPDPSTL